MAGPGFMNPEQQALLQLALSHPEVAGALMASQGIQPPAAPAGPGGSIAAAATPGGMTGGAPAPTPTPPVPNAGPDPTAMAGLAGLAGGGVQPSMPADQGPPPPPSASVQSPQAFQPGIAQLIKQLLMSQQQAQPMSLGAAIQGRQ